MADQVMNFAKGRAAEWFRDANAKGGILLLVANETEANLVDHDDLAALIGAAGNTEASDASYARKTGLTATITDDDTNNRVEIDLPDQTWSALAGAAIVKAVAFYEEAAADASRRPISHHDFAITPDGSDVTLEVNGSGLCHFT